MTLADMADDEPITSFVGERWKAAFSKKSVPNPQSLAYNKVLRPIWEGEAGWILNTTCAFVESTVIS
jgi:hypothetical protein